MCEFKINRVEGQKTQKISEDVIFFKYKEDGTSQFADILGRFAGSNNAFVTEINMFESRHDIAIIESDIVPFIAKFMHFLNAKQYDNSDPEISDKLKKVGNDLINEIKKKCEIS